MWPTSPISALYCSSKVESTTRLPALFACDLTPVARARAEMAYCRIPSCGSRPMNIDRKPHPARLLGIAAGLMLVLSISAAHAQYPTRPIRLYVPNPPGGASDTIARIVAPKLGEALGQPVVVENRPGSNGNLSSELTAKAPPDGYTLLLGQDSQIVISPHLYKSLAVDPLKDLAPVSTLINTQMVLSVNPAVPVKDFKEF